MVAGDVRFGVGCNCHRTAQALGERACDRGSSQTCSQRGSLVLPLCCCRAVAPRPAAAQPGAGDGREKGGGGGGRGATPCGEPLLRARQCRAGGVDQAAESAGAAPARGARLCAVVWQGSVPAARHVQQQTAGAASGGSLMRSGRSGGGGCSHRISPKSVIPPVQDAAFCFLPSPL